MWYVVAHIAPSHFLYDLSLHPESRRQSEAIVTIADEKNLTCIGAILES